jgi:hypothetical protein
LQVFTYMLWEGKDSERISKGSALYNCGHIHAVIRQRCQWDQWKDTHFANTNTYMLWEGKGGNKISVGVCTLKA